MQAAVIGKGLLREATLLPQCLEIEADPAPNIHVRQGTAGTPIDLQTMSLILLDFTGQASDLGVAI